MKRVQRLTKFANLIAGIAIIIAFLIVGAVFHWAWAGFDKPLYDWMQLLIIPFVLALIAVWFNRIDKKNELAIVQKRADDERTLAIDNQQEVALQGYLDRMQELLLHEQLRKSKLGDEVRNVARMRTLTMLYQLNTRRTNYVLSFLRESELVTADTRTTIITFSQADLPNADLHGINLRGTDLSSANLSDANLSGINLSGANLSDADLRHTDLSGANLRHADLKHTDLSGANLNEANLSGANLNEANLSGANLSYTHLGDAYLSGAKIDKSSLDKSTITKEQIATMNIVSL